MTVAIYLHVMAYCQRTAQLSNCSFSRFQHLPKRKKRIQNRRPYNLITISVKNMNNIVIPDPNRLGQICLESFEHLPKTGKPKCNTEWTVLSCIAQHQHDTREVNVIAIGTGNSQLLFKFH